MIKNKHKIISVVLCLALVLCSFFALSLTVSAASGDTVYVRVPGGWSEAHCYMWTDGSGNNGKWPGPKMTATSESGVYSYTLTGNFSNIIFNNGNSGVGTNQTGDMAYSNYNGYICDLSKGVSSPSWSVYPGGGDTTNPTVPPTNPPGDFVIYLKNSAKWSAPTCYMWNGSGGAGNENHAWPGIAMTSLGEDVWMLSSTTTYANVIFSNNNGSSQTPNLQARNSYIYDNQTNSWDVYDPKPIQVKSVSADPDSDLYVGMEIALSANAVSSDGTVSYKFSVNGSTIRDWSTNGKTTWTPTAAGTYTVTFDFKDTAGNDNTRSMTLQVSADTNVTSPIIKKVTPSDNGYVRTGSATINVTAGGGKTGTNLLFYKYEIEDPTGSKNTAYYTLNASYTYNFNREGDYKVKVTVQASDNSEASKSFTVKATGSDIPTEPTDPTQPQPGYQVGDVNKDGVIDIKDATYLSLALAQKTGYTVTLELGDVNKDGYLNARDVTALQRYVADKS